MAEAETRYLAIKAWWASSNCTSEDGLKHLQLWLAFWHFRFLQWGGFMELVHHPYHSLLFFLHLFSSLCAPSNTSFLQSGKGIDPRPVGRDAVVQSCGVRSQQVASSLRQQGWRSICCYCGRLHSRYQPKFPTLKFVLARMVGCN